MALDFHTPLFKNYHESSCCLIYNNITACLILSEGEARRAKKTSVSADEAHWRIAMFRRTHMEDGSVEVILATASFVSKTGANTTSVHCKSLAATTNQPASSSNNNQANNSTACGHFRVIWQENGSLIPLRNRLASIAGLLC